MTKKKGFTLVEILITIIVMAVLAGIALPSFQRSITRSEALQAISYLRVIRAAEKTHFAKWKTYVAAGNTAAIKTQLTVDAGGTKNYFFDVTTPTTTTFLARARNGSAPVSCATAANTFCLDQAGAWTGNSNYLPPATFREP